MGYPHRVQLWEWKKGKVLPHPNSIKKIKDEKLREEVALIAIKKYLPFIKTKKKVLEVMK